MKFGPVPVRDAQGAILAHSEQAADPADGYRSLTYKIAKGTVLSHQHVLDLEANDHKHVTVARLEPGDVEENAAALFLARALAPKPDQLGLRLSGVGAGRVNLIADGAGVVEVDAARIAAFNAVDPMITVATLGDKTRVVAGTMVATIKIISYAVPEAALISAAQGAAGALHLRAPVFASATLIETSVRGATPPDKGRRAMAGRLERLGLMLSPRVVVPHDPQAIAETLRDAPGEVLLILTASATSDPHDTAPQGLRMAGGTVTRFGMPVDPGNLLFLGALNDRPVIGLPGCARSPALNGADWVLERVVCGIPVSATDIAAMGVGGLLKEIPTRPRPRT